MTKRKKYVLIRCVIGIVVSTITFLVLKHCLLEYGWIAPTAALGIIFVNNITT